MGVCDGKSVCVSVCGGPCCAWSVPVCGGVRACVCRVWGLWSAGVEWVIPGVGGVCVECVWSVCGVCGGCECV